MQLPKKGSVDIGQIPTANLVPFERKVTSTGLGDDVEGPSASNVDFEWRPEREKERIEGQLVTMHRMSKGGLALTLHLHDSQWTAQHHTDGKAVIVLYKGGAWFETQANGFDPPLAVGDYLRIRFDGLEPARPGESPGRKYSVGRRKSV